SKAIILSANLDSRGEGFIAESTEHRGLVHGSVQAVVTSHLALVGTKPFIDNLVGKLISLVTRVDTSTNIWLLVRRRLGTVLELSTSAMRRLASNLLWLSVVARWLSRSETEELIVPGLTGGGLLLHISSLG